MTARLKSEKKTKRKEKASERAYILRIVDHKHLQNGRNLRRKNPIPLFIKFTVFFLLTDQEGPMRMQQKQKKRKQEENQP